MTAENSARMGNSMRRPVRVTSGLTLSALLAASLLVGQSPTAHADPSSYNVVDRQPDGVTSDVLPTTQIDGVAWDQKIVGNTVYVGGEFSNARPAGAPRGQRQTPRRNLLTYDLTTGNLIESFKQDTNASVNVIAVSPDQSRVYIGGTFTSVGGQNRYHLAAFNTADGSLVSNFAPYTDASVNSIVVTDSAVYVGGGFSRANGVSRTRLAAFSPTDGSLLGWAPTADDNVKAMTMSPDQKRIIVGGTFSRLNRVRSAGTGSLDAANGTVYPFRFNSVVNTGTPTAGVYSLNTDGKNIVATAFSFGSARFEGLSMFDPYTGDVKWVADCYGDTYDATIKGGQVYAASHHHNCSNVSSFPQFRTDVYVRADAWTYDAKSTVKSPSASGMPNFAGQPTPAHINWFPEFAAGDYTRQYQGPWTIESNDKYVVAGGEFPVVNGIKQEGLVRFGVPGVAPSKDAPVVGDSELTPVITVDGASATLTWQTSWDRDNMALDYQIVRDDNNKAPIATVKGNSLWWDRPTLSYTDTNLEPGKTYTYWIFAVDPDGNRTRSYNTTITAGKDAASDIYKHKVVADKPSHFWRMGESGWRTESDLAGTKDLRLGGSLQRDVSGFVEGNSATFFSGDSFGWASTSEAESVPKTYSAETWINTTTTRGGLILGLGDRSGGNTSRQFDRQVYMTNSGKLAFALKIFGSSQAVISPKSYNDGHWHHIVTTNSDSGMKLYVDGDLVAQNAAGSGANEATGYWRIGSDEVRGLPSAPISRAFRGTIDDTAIYSSELSQAAIRAHAGAGGINPTNTPPVAAFTESCTAGVCTFDGTGSTDPDGTIASYTWDFGNGQTGSGQKAEHTWTEDGTYPVTLTVADDRGATSTATHQVTVKRGNQAPVAKFVSTATGLTLKFDGTGSTDDESVKRWEWSFGDGITASGSTAEHTYDKAGTYSVELTVFDQADLKATLKKDIVVLENGAVLVKDGFNGTRDKWGDADSGGSWTYLQGRGSFSAGDNVGKMTLNAGMSAQANLSDVQAQDVVLNADVSIDKKTTGGGANFLLVGRKSASNDYRAKLRFLADGSARIGLSRVVGGVETVLKEVVLTGGYEPGKVVHVQLSIKGAGSTNLGVKAWTGDVEPANFNTSAVDTTAELQAAGSVGIIGYASMSATNAPFSFAIDNFSGMKPA